jgi:predicted SprT family Zn-dependent metalloprotease
MKIKIPEKFSVGPFSIPVILKNNLWTKEQKVGIADLGKQKIFLQAPLAGELNENCCKQAFLHELFHLLLFYSGQRELYDDEVLVDVLATMLMQVLETSTGDALAKWRKKNGRK